MNGTIISWQKTPITIVLCVVCIIVYLLMLTDMGAGIFHTLKISTSASELTEVKQGQIWRLITPIFMHGSVSHLVFNVMNMIIFGGRIEYIDGQRKYLSIVVISAIISNIAQWIANGPNFLGISGVVFALVGYLGVRKWRFPDYPVYIPNAFYIFVGLYLLAGVSGVLDAIIGARIANTAHIVGLVTGGLLALKR